MKTGRKILLAALSLFVFMTLIPLLVVKFSPDWAGIGLWFLCFFAVNPILVIVLSIIAGTELGKLWWIPFGIAAAFPLLFGIAISDFVPDLYVYSAFYLPIGIAAMLGTHFGKQRVQKKNGKE